MLYLVGKGVKKLEKKNNNGIIILLMGVIIVILVVLCVLFATGKVSFKTTTNENQINDNDNVVDDMEESKLSEVEATSIGKDLYDKATEIFSTWNMLPYCGYSFVEIHNQKTINLGNNVFYESSFNNIDELKNYLLNYLSSEIVESNINEEAQIDLNKITDYQNYIIYNNKLYCRQNSGKGWLSLYLGNYDIKVNNIQDNKITYIISSYYAKDYDTTCNTDAYNGSLTNCPSESVIKKDTNFTIEKQNDKWIVTDYTLHE